MLHRRLLFALTVLSVALTAVKPVVTLGQLTQTCAVTTPQSPPFVPPFPYPAAVPRQGWFWYGNDALWTWLPMNGKVLQNESKSFWWHPGFYPRIEPKPALRIEAIEMATKTRVLVPSAGNAFAEEMGGWTILTSLPLPVAGCWNVTATYQGATVRYVVAVD